MDHALPLLISNAQAARDQQAALARSSAGAVLQARQIEERLAQFRTECLARSPAGQGRHADAQALADNQVFLDRLDLAIGMQQQELRRRQAHSDAAQQQMVECQRRLMALEILERRRAAERAAKTSRREQRDADEHAARVARRQTQDPSE